MVQPQNFKHIPGKPWIILSEPLQTGEVVTINYMASSFPDMVITNWDSNKGNYIFYNTESSVGIGEIVDKEATEPGAMRVWPVPARESVRITVSGNWSGTEGQWSWVTGNGTAEKNDHLEMQLYDSQGRMVRLVIWPEGTSNMTVDVSDLCPGAYIAVLTDQSQVIDKCRLIVH